jgi:uncharacterized protein (TIGR03000 family)
MYGVILLTAMAAGGDVQQTHCFGGGHGGCYGGCYGGYGGCYGGCYGGYGGCHGGCYGGGYGCYGGGYGCYGGGYGCYGGCYGGGYGHGHACFGMYQGHGCYGCSGWTGCHGCYGGYGCYGAPVMPVIPGPIAGPKPESGPKPKEAPPIEETKANLTVELPEDAKLYVDGVLTKSTSAKRDFVTPILEKGKTYYYTLKAEMVRDGQTITVNGQVILQAGQNVQATLTEPTSKGTFVVKIN